jgi:Uma2 family endonuclease
MAYEQTMALPRRVRFKADDIWDTPDDGKRYEVIDGALIVSPTPRVPHQRAVLRLATALSNHVRAQGLGEVFVAPTAVILDDENALEPDVVFVSRDRIDIVTERAIEGAPDLVVEVLSDSSRAGDRGLKQRLYARMGIPHYWLIDPRARTLEALGLVETEYRQLGTYSVDQRFRPELFPGLEIPIDDLWS